MFLIDSNIIVYSNLPAHEYLRALFFEQSVFISEISRLEVLGYHKIKEDEDVYFKNIFKLVPIIFPSQEIYDTAIEIRKSHNLKLGDSIIAATALVHKLAIYSRNLKDFEKVDGLVCINLIR